MASQESALSLAPLVRRAVFFWSAILLAAGCSLAVVTPTLQPPKPAYTQAPPTPPLTPIATVGPSGPGQPYSAEAIALELQDVSYNFPPQLKAPAVTEMLAQAIADQLWTYDGSPYREVWIQGSCDESGLGRCELTLSGLPPFAPTIDSQDGYAWSIDLASGLIAPLGRPQLKGYPPELDAELDALARSLDTEGRLAEKGLLGVEWVLAPAEDAYLLRYGKGEEEGDPTLYVTLDRTNKEILAIAQE